MTWEEVRNRLGLSALWFVLWAILSASFDWGIPLLVLVLIGLAFGFLGTAIFVWVRGDSDDHHHGGGSGGSSSGGGDWGWSD